MRNPPVTLVSVACAQNETIDQCNGAEAMDEHGHPQRVPGVAAGGERKHAWWIVGGLVASAALLLGIEHRAHLAGLLGWLPYVVLLACPLMHLFMHGGHGGHGGRPGRGNERRGHARR